MRSASANSSSRQPPASAKYGQASSRCTRAHQPHTSPIRRTGKGLAFAQNQIQTELKGALIKNCTLAMTPTPTLTHNPNPNPNPNSNPNPNPNQAS